MSGFEIPLFPDDTAVLTVTTTVLVGVWVVAVFNLSFGWTLSALVVPGYLVPLMIAKPWAASVIVFESIITYLIVVALSERPRFLPYWCSFFGRDRFFALVLVSVLVRALCDGWMLPWLGQLADERLGISIDYRNDLHSYGLIIVSLLANYFWKPGLRRGLVTMFTGCFATYFLTRYVLVALTNFNIGDLQHTYEDIASSLLASPKAYIVIITTSYLASFMNLRYGWEFNGILIPALLGLLWYEPVKIVVTIAESLVLLGMGTQLLKLPIFQRTTMEGARKLLFFFTLCYCQRLALAHLLPYIAPTMGAGELFGFGFLLTTLLAIKAHDKKLTIRLLRGTVQVSFMGAIAGSVLGFLLMKFPDTPTYFEPSVVGVAETAIASRRSDHSLDDLVRSDKVLLYQMRAGDQYQSPVNAEFTAFRRSLSLIDEFQKRRAPELLDRLSHVAAGCNYEVLVVKDQYLYLRERSPARGWGIYVFNLNKPDGLCVEVPAPLDEWSTIESGLLLAKKFDAASIAIAGADRQTNRDGTSDVLSQHRTIFSEFHRARSRDNVLQVRGHTRSALRRIARVVGGDDAVNLKTAKSQLWVSSAMPRSLRPRMLKELVPGFELFWQDSPLTNVLRDTNDGGFAELRLARQDRRRLLTQLIVDHDSGESQPGFLSGHLHEWLLTSKDSLAEKASGAYQVATVPEMLFFDQEVITPLLRLISRDESPAVVNGTLTCGTDTRQDLRAIQAAAQGLGYDLVLFHDDNRQEVFVILHEPVPQRNWGTYVYRWYLAEPYLVEVPRPLLERNVFEFGVALFDRPAASVLSIAGAHPRANPDGTADLIRQSNRVNLLNLTRQVMMRETGQRPMLVLQARAILAPTRADVVMATDSGDASDPRISPLKRQVIDQLNRDGMSTAFVDGSYETAGYEVSSGLRAATAAWENKEVATLWLSPMIRASYRDQTQNRSLAAQCIACDIPAIHADLFTVLESRGTPAVVDPSQTGNLHDQATPVAELLAYVADQDVVRLAAARRQFDDWDWTFLTDRRSGQAFLLVAENENVLPVIVRVSGTVISDEQQEIEVGNLRSDTIDEFVGSRAAVLRFIERGDR